MTLHEPTAEQEAVISLPPDTKALVTAGAGTGKTEVLIHRLAKLVRDDGMGPGAEILVLTFSRAAVREIRRRLKQVGGDVSYVRARTFDSYATRLLNLYQPGGSWLEKGYDDRIAAATELTRSDQALRGELGRYRHFVVDELQDLVGCRAEFTQVILKAMTGGFTLLGDPAQGIYNFQLEGKARRIGSGAIYSWLKERFEGELKEFGFSTNFRACCDLANRVLWAGPQLNAKDPSYESVWNQLDSFVRELTSLGDVQAVAHSLDREDSSTAILCRTNGQALAISDELFRAGADHVLQPSATDRILAPWPAILLRGLSSPIVGRSRFLQLFEERKDEISAPEPEAAWKLLKRAARTGANTLELRVLAECFRAGDFPDDLSETPASRIVVSTIHKAKGLEFDRVILVQFDAAEGELTAGDADVRAPLAEETRLLYVALTRARDGIYHMNPPNTKGLRKHARCQRWVLKGFKKWQVRAFEVRGEDVHDAGPAGTFEISQDPVECQRYIRASVKRGDEVTLKRTRITENNKSCCYVVEHREKPVGVMAERLARPLYQVLSINPRWTVNWPIRITNLRVEAIDTVAGSGNTGTVHGLGCSNLWLRVRVAGLGSLAFEKISPSREGSGGS